MCGNDWSSPLPSLYPSVHLFYFPPLLRQFGSLRSTTFPACHKVWARRSRWIRRWCFYQTYWLLHTLPPFSSSLLCPSSLAEWPPCLSALSPLSSSPGPGPAHPGSFIMDREGSPRACRPLSAPAIASLWLPANKCRISKSLLKPGGPFSAYWVRVTELLSLLLLELFVSPPFADTDPHKINDF